MSSLATARFSMTEDDVIALNTRVMLKSPRREATYQRNWRNGVAAGFFIFIGLGGVAFVTAPTLRLSLYRSGVWVACYAVFWSMYAAHNLTRSAFEHKMIRITERLVRTRKVPFILGPVEVQLHSDRLVVVDDEGSSERAWSSASRVAEEPDAIYIEFRDDSMFRVPNKAFTYGSERDAFLQAVRLLTVPA